MIIDLSEYFDYDSKISVIFNCNRIILKVCLFHKIETNSIKLKEIDMLPYGDRYFENENYNVWHYSYNTKPLINIQSSTLSLKEIFDDFNLDSSFIDFEYLQNEIQRINSNIQQLKSNLEYEEKFRDGFFNKISNLPLEFL